MRRVAITGGIGEGKSTVLGYLEGLGARTASSDSIAREILSRPSIQARVADELSLPAGAARETIRSKISAEPGARRALNRVMHPLVLAEIARSNANFIEIPLLIEAALYGEFDSVWVVTCGSDEQLARLTARYGSREAAQALLATQLPSRAKVAFGDVIVRTNLPPPRVMAFVSEALTWEKSRGLQLG